MLKNSENGVQNAWYSIPISEGVGREYRLSLRDCMKGTFNRHISDAKFLK